MTLIPVVGKTGDKCFIAKVASPRGLSFMVKGGKIVRATMTAPANLKTIDGFKRGDKEGAINGFYAGGGGVSDFPLAEGSDISVLASPEFSDGDNKPRIVYEVTDAQGVIAIYAGWVPRLFANCPPQKPAT